METVGWNIGASVAAQGFSMTGQYYDGEALGVILFSSGGGFGFNCDAMGCSEADNDGFYVQAAYTSTALPRSAAAMVSPAKMLIR